MLQNGAVATLGGGMIQNGAGLTACGSKATAQAAQGNPKHPEIATRSESIPAQVPNDSDSWIPRGIHCATQDSE